MWYVVELRNHIVQQFWSGESVLRLDLWTEVSQNDDSWHLWPQQYGPHKKFEMSEPLRIAAHVSAHWVDRKKAYLGSAASNSRMIRSALSGRWCLLQYA